MKKAIKIVGIIYSAAYLLLLVFSIVAIISLVGTEEGQSAEGLEAALREIFAVIHGALAIFPAVFLVIALVPTILAFVKKTMPKALWIIFGVLNLLIALPLGILCLIYVNKMDEIEGTKTPSEP